MDKRPPLIIIIGPTAVGKTAASLDLAMRIDAEIISADSRLFYRGMDIGTAKPSPIERASVPHHMIDFLNPDDTYSLGEFQNAVYKTADDILRRGRIPIMVGGTGQYVRAITEGWIIPTQEPDIGLRNTLTDLSKSIGTQELHRWLTTLDPAAGNKIDHRNVRRTIRALEVIFKTGNLFSSQRRAGEPRFRTLIIGLMRPRNELYKRIDSRIEIMFANGFIDEVKDLLTNGYHAELPSMSAIGYQEVYEFINGTLPLKDAIILMKRRTRAFVRRQANWFKTKDPSIRWFLPEEDFTKHIETFLAED